MYLSRGGAKSAALKFFPLIKVNINTIQTYIQKQHPSGIVKEH